MRGFALFAVEASCYTLYAASLHLYSRATFCTASHKTQQCIQRKRILKTLRSLQAGLAVSLSGHVKRNADIEFRSSPNPALWPTASAADWYNEFNVIVVMCILYGISRYVQHRGVVVLQQAGDFVCDVINLSVRSPSLVSTSLTMTSETRAIKAQWP